MIYNNNIITPTDWRAEKETRLLCKLESGAYKLSLNDYIKFNVHYNTHHHRYPSQCGLLKVQLLHAHERLHCA